MTAALADAGALNVSAGGGNDDAFDEVEKFFLAWSSGRIGRDGERRQRQRRGRKLNFYVNFIGGPEIQFFAVVQRGVEDAGKDLGVNAIYSGPKCCDINMQAQLLKANVAAKPDGIAVEFNDPKALSK